MSNNVCKQRYRFSIVNHKVKIIVKLFSLIYFSWNCVHKHWDGVFSIFILSHIRNLKEIFNKKTNKNRKKSEWKKKSCIRNFSMNGMFYADTHESISYKLFYYYYEAVSLDVFYISHLTGVLSGNKFAHAFY